MIIHLYSNNCHDEGEVWCGEDRYYNPPTCDVTHLVNQATCEACLLAGIQFGIEASLRSSALRTTFVLEIPPLHIKP